MLAYTAGDEMEIDEAEAIVADAVQEALRKQDNTKLPPPNTAISSR